MGMFRIEIEGTGGHGCSRDIGDGQELCTEPLVAGETVRMPPHAWGTCIDCDARHLVAAYQRRGVMNLKATLIHWPSDPNEVRDDLVTGVRSGTFPEHPSRRNVRGAS